MHVIDKSMLVITDILKRKTRTTVFVFYLSFISVFGVSDTVFNGWPDNKAMALHKWVVLYAVLYANCRLNCHKI